MHELAEQMTAHPVIAAVKTSSAIEAALHSECETILLLSSSLGTVRSLVHRIHDAGKLAIVHVDLVEGLSSREMAVDGLMEICRPDGLISTHPQMVRRARQLGLLTIQRTFLIDSLSLSGLPAQLKISQPDFVEILPGIMPQIISEVVGESGCPVIAGGLIRTKKEVLDALHAGASAVSTSSAEIWTL